MDSLALQSPSSQFTGPLANKLTEYTETHDAAPDSVPLGRVSTGIDVAATQLEAQGLSVFRGCATTLENNDDGSFP